MDKDWRRNDNKYIFIDNHKYGSSNRFLIGRIVHRRRRNLKWTVQGL